MQQPSDEHSRSSVSHRSDSPSHKSIDFTFQTDFDENGVLYFLGTEGGRAQTWSNPAEKGLVSVAMAPQPAFSGNKNGAISRSKQRLRSKQRRNPWLAIDLGPSRKLVCTCALFARARIAEYATQSHALRLSRRSTSIPCGMEGTRMRGHSGTGSFKGATTATSGKRCECTSTMRVSKAGTVWPAGMSRLARPSVISGSSMSRQPPCNLALVASNCMAALSCRTPAPRRPAAFLLLLQLREHIKSVAIRLTCGPLRVSLRIYSNILVLINKYDSSGREG